MLKHRGKGKNMINIKVNEEEYKIEFSFEAAENKDIVQKMFNIRSGAYFVKNAPTSNGEAETVINGTSDMVADIASICTSAFYAGMLENNPVSAKEAKSIMKEYMKANKLNFFTLYKQLGECMEDDGFFELSGITAMIQAMSKPVSKKIANKKQIASEQ